MLSQYCILSNRSSYIRVKLSHPYIGARENNRLRNMRRVIREWLEDTDMVIVAQKRTQM